MVLLAGILPRTLSSGSVDLVSASILLDSAFGVFELISQQIDLLPEIEDLVGLILDEVVALGLSRVVQVRNSENVEVDWVHSQVQLLPDELSEFVALP